MSKPPSLSPSPLLQGGVQPDPVQLFIANLDSPAKLIYGFIVILIVVYSPIIPDEYRIFMDSVLGRLFGIAIVYGVIESLGWIYGLLTALAFILVINGASRYIGGSPGGVEGFEGAGALSKKKTVGNRWFVEKVLGENPNKIITDQVATTAIHS
jgi:hypothetical protein